MTPWLPRRPPFPELESPTEVELSNLDQKAGLQQEFRGVSPTVLALAAETALLCTVLGQSCRVWGKEPRLLSGLLLSLSTCAGSDLAFSGIAVFPNFNSSSFGAPQLQFKVLLLWRHPARVPYACPAHTSGSGSWSHLSAQVHGMPRTACAHTHMHTRLRTDSPSNAALTCAQARQISLCAHFAGLWFSSPVATFLLGPPGLPPSSSAPLSWLCPGREEAAAEV